MLDPSRWIKLDSHPYIKYFINIEFIPYAWEIRMQIAIGKPILCVNSPYRGCEYKNYLLREMNAFITTTKAVIYSI